MFLEEAVRSCEITKQKGRREENDPFQRKSDFNGIVRLEGVSMVKSGMLYKWLLLLVLSVSYAMIRKKDGVVKIG